jgi:hypothetical protein
MPQLGFQVDIDDQSVKVRLSVSEYSRFYASIFFIAIGLFVVCGVLFLPGKHGNPSMWHDLSSSPVNSGDFIVPLVLLLGTSILMVLISWRYVVSAYPSDQILHCDKSTLTISKVRWLDIHNEHWNTRSYALAEIEKMRYQTIASAKGGSIYGLRFIARGKPQRVLPGLEPREADKILKALKAFGADVPDDPALSKKLADEAAS